MHVVPKECFSHVEESRIFRSRRLLLRARRRSCHYCYQRLRWGSRLSNSCIRSLPYCSAITTNDAFKRTKRVTFPISIFETFHGARGSLNRVPLVYDHVVRFTIANGRKRDGVRDRAKGERDEGYNRRGKGKTEKVFAAFVRAHLRLERYNVSLGRWNGGAEARARGGGNGGRGSRRPSERWGCRSIPLRHGQSRSYTTNPSASLFLSPYFALPRPPTLPSRSLPLPPCPVFPPLSPPGTCAL